MRARFKDTPGERRKFLLSLAIMLALVVAVLLWRSILAWPGAWAAWVAVACRLDQGYVQLRRVARCLPTLARGGRGW